MVRDGVLSAVNAGVVKGWFPVSEVKDLQMRIRDLERLFILKTMVVSILKDAIQIAYGKN